MDFWDLPGPSSFLDGICEDLAEGRNTTFGLPLHSPPGIKGILRDRLVGAGWGWYDLDFGNRPDPVLLMKERFGGSRGNSPVTPVDIARLNNLCGSILWLTGLSESNWPVWKAFLEEYQDACRELPQTERGLFLVALSGKLATNAPKREVCLVNHVFDDIVDEIDMTLYSASRLRSKVGCSTRRYLLAKTICRLVLWDAELADLLVSETPEVILSPEGLLREIAKERRWTEQTTPMWCAGTGGLFAGQKHVHSALLALNGQSVEIASRIWKAQVEVLLPLLEDHRLRIIRKMRKLLQLQLPHKIGNVLIESPEELELGQVEYLLGKLGADKRIIVKVGRLKKIRNALAHLEPLPLDQALAGELYSGM